MAESYFTLQELGRRWRRSKQTIFRHLKKGHLEGIVWVDFMGDGKLLATQDSVLKFEEERRASTMGRNGKAA